MSLSIDRTELTWFLNMSNDRPEDKAEQIRMSLKAFIAFG